MLCTYEFAELYSPKFWPKEEEEEAKTERAREKIKDKMNEQISGETQQLKEICPVVIHPQFTRWEDCILVTRLLDVWTL
jgi:hypothetical protein